MGVQRTAVDTTLRACTFDEAGHGRWIRSSERRILSPVPEHISKAAHDLTYAGPCSDGP
jgi:hypothetical protein